MAGSRAALKVGLIGGLVIGLAVAAQQVTDSPDLRLLGFAITFGGFGVTGFIAARDAAQDSGEYERGSSLRAGAVGGLVAGLLSSLAIIAVLLILAINGDNMRMVEMVIRQVYSPEQLQQLQEAGFTVEAIAQMTVAMQIMCCGGGLPVMGLVLGALGGIFVPGMHRNRDQ